MRRRRQTLPHRSPWRWAARFAGPLLIAVGAGCSLFQISPFEQHLADGDAAWVARQSVTCETDTTGCARLHLLKGTACLQLAATGPHPLDHLTCAAEQLQIGMDLHPAWRDTKDTKDQRTYQERLCEALERLHTLQPDAHTLKQFEDAAEELYRLAPESVAAIYYLASLRLQEATPFLETLDAGNRLPVCRRLKRALNRLLAVTSGDPERMPGWEPFAEKYEQLAFRLGLALRTAGCR
ncbi:hypothetical protein DESC_610284 [Desulfosarcina cetonica]|uniref:hypothetical protein n=1 Tax=Desulfosarcina cetonica TaxID=90730 RepID=UPI0006D12A00|nr:hypothetical protein [Desulfosarcina cetonica]VTR67701.1 hypothetical protein DESC_610284 [Desulfosarcina cetonica]